MRKDAHSMDSNDSRMPVAVIFAGVAFPVAVPLFKAAISS